MDAENGDDELSSLLFEGQVLYECVLCYNYALQDVCYRSSSLCTLSCICIQFVIFAISCVCI